MMRRLIAFQAQSSFGHAVLLLQETTRYAAVQKSTIQPIGRWISRRHGTFQPWLRMLRSSIQNKFIPPTGFRAQAVERQNACGHFDTLK